MAASSNALRAAAAEEARDNKADSGDVCQYSVEHGRVMFRSVRASYLCLRCCIQ